MVPDSDEASATEAASDQTVPETPEALEVRTRYSGVSLESHFH